MNPYSKKIPMEYESHHQFYDLNGDEIIGSKLSPVTYEEHYQHIKARLATEIAQEVIETLTGMLSASTQAPEASQDKA